jgi:hypothetical protein
VKEALEHFEAVARFDSPVENVHTRVAEHGGHAFIDIGNKSNRAIEVAATGWTLLLNAAKVRRPPFVLASQRRFHRRGSVRDRAQCPHRVAVRAQSTGSTGHQSPKTGDKLVTTDCMQNGDRIARR